MSRFNIGTFRTQPKGWQEILVDRINQGKMLPLISNVVCNDLVFNNHHDLITTWADYIEYPHPDRHNLHRTSQFQSVTIKADPQLAADHDRIKMDYLDFLSRVLQSVADEQLVTALQNHSDNATLPFSEQAARLETPTVENSEQNPLLLLANLPLPIYLTTSYHTFVEAALRRAGKEPKTAVCPWNNRPHTVPNPFDDDSYQPTPERPLVYHLHGLDSDAASLVLTEDDYLDFLVAISRHPDLVPVRVRQALVDSALVMLGYSLSDWDFRVLFRGLIKTSTVQHRPKSVFVQLEDSDTEHNTYLKNYLRQEADFEVYWGTIATFLQEIYKKWEGT